jgi:triosephosphate isomerase (TIM)
MNRKPFIAGNWKMYKTVAEARHLVSELVPGLQPYAGVEKVLCPPYTDLLAVKALLEGSDIGLGAQDMHWEDQGAFTGAISPLMVAELCQYVIIGHSERRQYFGETDETVNKKVKAALAHGITPIVAIGETLEENQSGRTAEVLARQVRQGLAGIAADPALSLAGAVPLVIAYEPVWAIGTGLAATGADANRIVAESIRPVVAELFGSAFAQGVRVLYGGSVKASNAAEFFGQPDIDGALVGGASLKAQEFIGIVEASSR